LSANPELAVLPNLRAVSRPGGRVVLTRKFVSGMQEYAKLWGGPLVAVMEPISDPSSSLDNVEVDPTSLDFGVEVLSYDSPDLAARLKRSAVVFGGVSHRQNHLADLGRALSVPVVFGTEYTLRTRLQIIATETPDRLRRLRRNVWEWRQERRQRRAIRLAQGIQCNGTPTYAAYRELSPDPLLFLDTRTTEDLFIASAALERRLARLAGGAPLRLAFSGRLNAMKGADHLTRVAQKLRERGVPFELAVCGDGPLAADMARDVERLGLSAQVKLRGVLDFRSELVPFVSESVDLFVCCHRQGDPSCTYLETFACGVPIAGYANEAFAGLLELADVGVATPLDEPGALAAAIARLAADRERLAELSRKSLGFAREHSFEGEFRRRIAHLRAIAERGVRA
jgi:glycosyltransferase involved in cell wall biosynthesis